MYIIYIYICVYVLVCVCRDVDVDDISQTLFCPKSILLVCGRGKVELYQLTPLLSDHTLYREIQQELLQKKKRIISHPGRFALLEKG